MQRYHEKVAENARIRAERQKILDQQNGVTGSESKDTKSSAATTSIPIATLSN